MSYGIEQWGIGSWGGSDFVVTSHIPSDLSTGVSRLPIIGFILSSQSGNVVLGSIRLFVNGIELIHDGYFTNAATGTIDTTNPSQVQVTAQVLHEFAPFELVTVVVTALNTSNEPPTLGNVWQFTVDNAIHTFQCYIVRKFERVFRSEAAGPLTPPANPHAEIDLDPPGGFGGVTI
jgi:hypothetical protein